MAVSDRARLLAYVGVIARLFRFKSPSRFGAVGRTDAALHAGMETLVERFSIAPHPPRAAASAELVGFSELRPMDRIVPLAGLEQALGPAEAAFARADIGFTPMRTTTGHGLPSPGRRRSCRPSCSQPSCSSTRRSVEPTSTRLRSRDRRRHRRRLHPSSRRRADGARRGARRGRWRRAPPRHLRAEHGWTYPAVNLGTRATIAGETHVIRLGLDASAASRAA